MKMSKNKNAPSESICNPLSFSFFSFQFFLRQYAFEVHGAAQSIISYYLPKTGLGILDRKKDIMQAKLPHTVLCIRTQLEFWHFLTFFFQS